MKESQEPDKNPRKINYKSDFDFLLPLYDCHGNEIGFPDHDFEAVFYTGSLRKTFVARQRQGHRENCYNDNGRIHVVCNNHGLGTGTLNVEFTEELPDAIYPDGHRRTVKCGKLNIELVYGSGDCPCAADVRLIAPYVTVTAYELAKEGGYTGTLEEYTAALNDMPELTQQATNLNMFLKEWAKGKGDIIKALGKWGTRADAADSFADLAAKIEALPVKGENEQGVIPHATSGGWDLLNELNNHRRIDYPYCWGVLLDDSYRIVELSGADAYYTSDGHFREGNGEHAFRDVPGRHGRYVIYYYREPEYMVQTSLGRVLSIVCLNGYPKFNISQPGSFVNEVLSYTKEGYELENGFYINSQFISSLILSGIETITGNTSIYNCTNLSRLELPDLKRYKGNDLLWLSTALRYISLPELEDVETSTYFLHPNSANIQVISLPKLKRISGGGTFVYGASGITELTLESLETIEGNTRVLDSCGALKKLSLPALRENGGNIAYNSSSVMELELPSLESISGGYVVYNCNALTSLELPALETMSGGTVAYNCGALTSLELPSLETMETTATCTIASGCHSLKELTIPAKRIVRRSGDYAIIENCSSIETLNFPNVEKMVWGANYGMIRGRLDKDLQINYPKLIDGDHIWIGYSITGNGSISINLGNQETSNLIWLRGRDVVSYIKSVTIRPGFRAYLRIDELTALTKDVLENIITNLGDNTGHDTLQVVFGAVNLAKISDEKKLEATNKNYTLS